MVMFRIMKKEKEEREEPNGRQRSLKYKDIVLRASDLDVLEGPCYLNDHIIGFYFSYLSSLCGRNDVLFVPPSVSFWLANCDVDSRKAAMEPLKFLSKRLVVFTVNDCDDLGGAESGTHWSTSVYDRCKNSFLHLDTMEGVNYDHAIKPYDSVKEFMGKAPVPSILTSSSLKAKTKEKDVAKQASKSEPTIAEPLFEESNVPQQTNGYDCGLYVMAIDKAVCECYSSGKSGKDADWFSAVQRHVDASVEMTFRNEVLELIEDLRKN
ncbi:hypothetical protein Cgig2_004261 [Carnegiea gigantea]|uniref:Ubiquitin-like protease family profile domain-containing protein n=1 Tax=Carnegiea gigantea TaxID=171969 RepID=A0A9Q1QIS3_9CARY|nr:hypothetical protein Cgig2_004261 [Carnegiea gigantea]